MNLEELEIDDEELDEGLEGQPDFDEDTYEKQWVTNEDEESNNDGNEDVEEVINEDEDILTTFLKSRNINPEAVKFESADGSVEEKRFDELSKEDQLQILGYDDSQDDYGLEDDEISIINELRENNLSADEYKRYIGQQAIKDYLESNSNDEPQKFEVDNIEDDELYILDLKAKIPELTEEDAASELELAKQNDTLYQKKVQGIRNEYKQREQLMNEQLEAEQREQNEKVAQEFENTIVNAIQENDTIDLGESSLKLSEDDMNEIASFILDSDVAGVRHIAKALNDPKTLVGMVWYALKGKEAFGQISDYYKQKITEASKYNYNKGYEDAKGGSKPNAAKTVVKKHSGKQPNKKIISIDDLD